MHKLILNQKTTNVIGTSLVQQFNNHRIIPHVYDDIYLDTKSHHFFVFCYTLRIR